MPNQAECLLKEYFGYDSFRPMQSLVIDALIRDRKDCLVLMPTGGGKSLCYQIPALLLDGVSVVISPLIALMRDQVMALKLNGIAAAYINSSQSNDEQSNIEQQCIAGKIKLLYVSPEKLQSDSFRQLLERINVALFAIDEAHCISFWGHDFRPDYKQLSYLKEFFPTVPMVALTATADRITRQDIVTQLRFKNHELFISSFDRPNIFLEVRPAQDRINQIIRFLQNRRTESGIIYCLSRKTTEDVARKLRDRGFDADAYHAGMENTMRSLVQDNFLRDRTQIVCATVAFGMGIDKSNVRFVIHYNLPKNIESYYQEIGRAGRDGLPANALLFYTFSDVALQHDMLKEEESAIKEIKLAKLERLQQFAETYHCRRRVLLAYFNENQDHDCHHCDVCQRPREMFDGTLETQKALSAIARTRQNETIGTIVDILRGYVSERVKQKSYQELKTFGAGRDRKNLEWHDYILQMVSLGYIDIAYDRNNVLILTEKSKTVLYSQESVTLAKHIPFAERAKGVLPTIQLQNDQDLDDNLLALLKQLCKKIADELGIPPSVVFADSTLRQMAIYKPQTQPQMLAISGIGQKKMQDYGEAFLQLLQNYATNEFAYKVDGNESLMGKSVPQSIRPKPQLADYRAALMLLLQTTRQQLVETYGSVALQAFNDKVLEKMCADVPVIRQQIAAIVVLKSVKADVIYRGFLDTIRNFLCHQGKDMGRVSQKVTYCLLLQGMGVQEVASRRFLTESTVWDHLMTLYAAHYDELVVTNYVSLEDLERIRAANEVVDTTEEMKPLYEFLNKRYSYNELKLALLYWKNMD